MPEAVARPARVVKLRGSRRLRHRRQALAHPFVHAAGERLGARPPPIAELTGDRGARLLVRARAVRDHRRVVRDLVAMRGYVVGRYANRPRQLDVGALPRVAAARVDEHDVLATLEHVAY